VRLPAGFTFASTPGVTIDGRQACLTIGSLAGGTSRDLTLNTTSGHAAALVQATATGTSSGAHAAQSGRRQARRRAPIQVMGARRTLGPTAAASPARVTARAATTAATGGIVYRPTTQKAHHHRHRAGGHQTGPFNAHHRQDAETRAYVAASRR